MKIRGPIGSVPSGDAGAPRTGYAALDEARLDFGVVDRSAAVCAGAAY